MDGIRILNLHEKKFLVTGGCGFIGSHLVEQLLRMGADVRVFARYTSTGSLGNLSFIPQDNFDIIYGDLRNPSIVRKAMQDVDIVFHLAALISIPYSYINPSEYFDVNVRSILNILETAREFSTELIIHTSTSEVYGTAEYVPIDENHPLKGQSPYSASKIAADKAVESFYRSYKSPVITLRPFNTYGPRQSSRAIIPTIILQLQKGSTLALGDLTPTRDFLYVTDTASSYLAATENYEKLLGRTCNVGTGRETSMKELTEIIGDLMKVKPAIKTDKMKIRPKDSEVRRLCCDASLFMSLTNWKPKSELREGLFNTIDFYKLFGESVRKSKYFV